MLRKIRHHWVELTATIILCSFVFYMCEGRLLVVPMMTRRLVEIGSIIIFIFALYIIFDKQELERERMYLITGALVILLLIFPFCVFDVMSGVTAENVRREITSMSIDYCAIIASAVSVLFVVITLVLQRKQLKESNKMTQQMIDNQVLEIIDKFLSSEMLEVRNTASELRDCLRYNTKTTTSQLVFAFERQIRDDYYKNTAWLKFKTTKAYEQYAAFTRLMRFFDMISHYELSSKTAVSIHFYYVWWRDFMIAVKDIFEKTWDSIPESQRHLSFKPNWIDTFRRLDDQLKKFGLKLE